MERGIIAFICAVEEMLSIWIFDVGPSGRTGQQQGLKDYDKSRCAGEHNFSFGVGGYTFYGEKRDPVI